MHRYAGVSAFGVGGTNAHLILAEHKPKASKPKKDNDHLIILSAKTKEALHQAQNQLIQYIETNDERPSSFNLADLAYTLQTGREGFRWRGVCVAKNKEQLKTNLLNTNINYFDPEIHPSLIFMFPGQGMQYHKMAAALMKIPFFSSWVKRGVRLAKSYLDLDLLELINNADDERLHQTQYAQPALFLIEYALAQLFIHLNLTPHALIGHSIGEYVAATLAGIFSFEDAIALVCQRGFLMASVTPGEMLAIESSLEKILPYLNQTELALHNSLNQVVVSGQSKAIEQLKQSLTQAGIVFHPLKVSHAFHSQSMEAIEQPFKQLFANLALSSPQIPMISNVTGTWISADEAIDPDYWYRHLRHTVQFSKGIETLLQDSHPLFIEIGPGHSLNSFLKPIAHHHHKPVLSTASLPVRQGPNEALPTFLSALGLLWQHGFSIDWQAYYEHHTPRLIPLPTYPFQRQNYWIEPDLKTAYVNEEQVKRYKPSWFQEPAYLKPIPLLSATLSAHTWVIFSDDSALSHHLINLLEQNKAEPIVVRLGKKNRQDKERHFYINPQIRNDYQDLFKKLKGNLKNPIFLHLYSYSNRTNNFPSQKSLDQQLKRSFYSVLYLFQGFLAELGNKMPLQLGVITSGKKRVIGTEQIHPINATLNSACRVMMQEQPQFKAKLFDLNPLEKPQTNSNLLKTLINTCLNEPWDENNLLAFFRNGYRWYLQFTPVLPQKEPTQRLKNKGIYVVTGGLGGIALSLCEAILKEVSHPTLILMSRRKLASQNDWKSILQNPNHEDYETVKALHQFQQLGATVVVEQVDISQFKQVQHCIKRSLAHFGAINGVIHTAGVSIPELAELTKEEFSQAVFKPKIEGTYHLLRALQSVCLDFIVFTSSLAALLGGYRQLNYASANATLDALTDTLLLPHCAWMATINWNTWRDVGIAARAASHGEAHFIGQGDDISPEEGQALFLSILKGNDQQVAISKRDIQHLTVNPPTLPAAPSFAIKVNRQSMKIATTYHPPATAIESELALLWQNALGIETIGTNDNFFSLGGHSLKAVYLIDKINQTLNCNLPATQLYQDPTIKQLAATIETKKEPFPAHEPILLKRVTEKSPYLFLCHPISGLIHCFNDLVLQSKLPLSIYGIQDPGITTPLPDFPHFLDLVEDHFNLIKKKQPKGPYYLVGYSFGGAILFEVANKLLKKGETISLLALIDSWAINSPLLQEEKSFKKYLKDTSQLPQKIIDLAWQREQILLNHQFQVLNQEILLFKASQLLPAYQAIDHPSNGWSYYNKGKILCHAINSDHDNMLNHEHCKNILQSITDYLQKTDRIASETFKKCTE